MWQEWRKQSALNLPELVGEAQLTSEAATLANLCR